MNIEKIKIEKNIPIHKVRIYPFGKMKIGDSFLLKGNTCKNKNKIYSCIKYFINKEKSKFKFTVRIISKNEIRIWRIK